MYEARMTQVWLSDINKLTELMTEHYKAPYVWYGAVHHAEGDEHDHAHILLFMPDNCEAQTCTYLNDEGNESPLKWMNLRAENGLIYPYHLKYSKSNDCFIQIDKKSRVGSADCFGLIKEVPEDWAGFWNWMPFTEDELITTQLDKVTSSKELRAYLRQNRGRVSRMDCYKVMGMVKVYEYLESTISRTDPAEDLTSDEQMEIFKGKLQ